MAGGEPKSGNLRSSPAYVEGKDGGNKSTSQNSGSGAGTRTAETGANTKKI